MAPASPTQPHAQHTENRDAEGNSRQMWRLVWPIILSNLSIPLLGAVDTGVVGHLTEPYYLGALAVASLIFSYLYWGFGFLRMGTTAFTAQAEGAGDTLETRAVFGRALLLGLGLGAVTIMVQVPVAHLALGLVGASAEVEHYARAYFDVRVWGAPAVLVNYVVVGCLLGMQRVRTALVIQVGMNGLNIALDLLFVIVFKWDVVGVAWATVFSEVTAAGAGLIIIYQLFKARTDGSLWGPMLRDRIFNVVALRRLLSVNRDIFLRTLCLVSAFAMFIARGAAMGDIVLGANAVLLNLQTFLSFGLDGFAHAAEILVGRASGARNAQRLRRVVAITTRWALITAIGYGLLFWMLGGAFIQLLTNIPELRTMAFRYLPWLILSPFISVWSFQLDGIFIGATGTAQMRNAMLLSLGVYIVALYFLVPVLGNHGLWLAFTIFMAARGLTLGACYPRLVRQAAKTQI